MEGVAYENINAVVNIVVDKNWTEETEYTEIELTTGVGEMAKERKSMSEEGHNKFYAITKVEQLIRKLEK